MRRLVKNNSNALHSPLSASESSKKDQIRFYFRVRGILSKFNYVLKHGDPYITYTVNFYESKYFINWANLISYLLLRQ